MNFYESLQKGRQAEALVKHAFEAMGYMVDDVTSMPAYWEKDIDLIIYDRHELPYYFEVKADWTIWKTDNVVIEISGKTGADGWFMKTESTHLAFCDMKNRIAYIARTKDIKNYVFTHPDLSHITLNGCYCILVNVNTPDLFNKVLL